MSDVLEHLDANGGPLAKAAAHEIRQLRERVTELTFTLITTLASVSPELASDIADALEKHGARSDGEH